MIVPTPADLVHARKAIASHAPNDCRLCPHNRAAGAAVERIRIADYLDTGQVERFPTAFLSSSLMVLAFLAVGIGMVMNAVMRATRETRRLFYLQLSA